MGFKEEKIKIILGAVGNTEWWTEKDWEDHREYCKKLKAEGRFGEVVEHTVKYEESMFDVYPEKENIVLESYKMVILDFRKNK